MSRPPEQVLRTADRFHPTGVYRVGEVVLREARPWSATVQALLRHLARVGFAAAPRVVEPGFDEHGRETLTFIHGTSGQPACGRSRAPSPSDSCSALYTRRPRAGCPRPTPSGTPGLAEIFVVRTA